MENKKFYVTTPIYYASGDLHLGHAYSTVYADALARVKRMQGYDTFFLTGSDEHGQKIERNAKVAGKTPQLYVDEIVAKMKELWKSLDISYDKFIRTTDADHKKVVQAIFERLLEQEDIYKSKYEGHYCIPCESFFTDAQLIDGKCPDCNREVEWTSEESYFFNAKKYQKQLEELFANNPEYLVPESRKNEMFNSFIKEGVKDICVSRTSFTWGVPLPFEKDHVSYVWVDALSNYITALGYGKEDTTLFNKYWPADVQLIGRDITRFHVIIWPMLLMALGLPQPKQIHSHGFISKNGMRISKSLGNGFDPYVRIERYGIDAVRYYLLKDGPRLGDADYTDRRFLETINADLTNSLGNLVSRTVKMVENSFDGVIPKPNKQTELDKELLSIGSATRNLVENAIDNGSNTQKALDAIFTLIRRANKYIDETMPWLLARDEGKRERLATVLYNLCESIRIAGVLLQGFLTVTPAKIFKALGLSKEEHLSWESVKEFGFVSIAGSKVSKGENLFNRLKVDDEVKFLEEFDGKNKVEVKEGEQVEEKKEDFISFDDFLKVEMKVGKVLECEKVEDTDKLLKSVVDMGDHKRTIVSGIALSYTPEQMVGQTVVVVTNLKPRKMRGILSEGMILAVGEDDANVGLVTINKDFPAGEKVE